jgi:hypothetical protein
MKSNKSNNARVTRQQIHETYERYGKTGKIGEYGEYWYRHMMRYEHKCLRRRWEKSVVIVCVVIFLSLVIASLLW